MKTDDLDSGLFQWSNCFVDVTTRNQAMVRDEQCAPKVQLAGQLAETFNDTSAKNDARARLKVERLQLQNLLKSQRSTKVTNDSCLSFVSFVPLYGKALITCRARLARGRF